MCGIFAYIGRKNNASELVLLGLKLMEYRGYDSWGVASKMQTIRKTSDKRKNENKSQFEVEKHVGKIGDAILSRKLKYTSNLSIGHTRWATHGGVLEKNAHPHLDCSKNIAVVHNGIIENYVELKELLLRKGHQFTSETDTEIIPHLIEENLKTKGFATSVRDTFNQLKGMNAVVVAYSLSSEIVAAKNGSPLVVGKSSDGFMIASDTAGIIKYTNEVLFIKDDEMVILGKNITLLTLPDGKKITPHFTKVNWKIEDTSLGKYQHYMLKEIYEQPKVIRNIAENYTQQIHTLGQIIKKSKGTFFIGAGSAAYACLSGTYLFSKIARLHVNMAFASEFNYLEDFLNSKSLIIALSQSGETIDIVEPLTRAKSKKSKIVAIVNVLGSTLYRMADYKLLLGAGPEKAVASTKAYVAKLAVLYSLSFSMIGETDKAKGDLLTVAHEIERILEPKFAKEIEKIAKFLKNAIHIYTIGRGASYPTALEAAMKIKEVSYVHTEGLSGGELKHGPLALISKGSPCIVFAPNDETYDAIISNATEIKSRGGVIIGISPFNNSVFDYWLEVKNLGEASIIAQIVPIQLLAYHMALLKKLDPDKPRNLAKSVTVK